MPYEFYKKVVNCKIQGCRQVGFITEQDIDWYLKALINLFQISSEKMTIQCFILLLKLAN